MAKVTIKHIRRGRPWRLLEMGSVPVVPIRRPSRCDLCPRVRGKTESRLGRDSLRGASRWKLMNNVEIVMRNMILISVRRPWRGPAARADQRTRVEICRHVAVSVINNKRRLTTNAIEVMEVPDLVVDLVS